MDSRQNSKFKTHPKWDTHQNRNALTKGSGEKLHAHVTHWGLRRIKYPWKGWNTLKKKLKSMQDTLQTKNFHIKC